MPQEKIEKYFPGVLPGVGTAHINKISLIALNLDGNVIRHGITFALA